MIIIGNISIHISKGHIMENNNMNEQQTNWQQALNEFSDQPQQPQQYAQQAQPQQYAQQAQPQQFAQQAQPQFNQQAQPQFNQQAQFAQADGQYMQQGMPAYDAGSFAVVPPKKKSSALKIILIVLAAVIVVGGIPLALYFAGVFGKSGGGYEIWQYINEFVISCACVALCHAGAFCLSDFWTLCPEVGAAGVILVGPLLRSYNIHIEANSKLL